MKPVLDWSEFPGGGAGFQGAAEMCNNNGACRKHQGGAMLPVYRATVNERDVRAAARTRCGSRCRGSWRRCAQQDEMMETLKLCVSCKACRRECPTGVDMAKMKIEVLAARAAKYGVTLRDRLIGYLPRYAPYAAKLGWLLNLRDRVPGLAKLSEPIIGFSARRKLPRWRMDIFEAKEDVVGAVGGPEVVLFADTFNRYYERENLDAALDVLTGAGYRVHLPRLVNGSARPLCCGRTFLTAGLVEEAKAEAARTMTVLLPFARRGIPIVGLEPSCIFTFRDEMPSMAPGEDAKLLAKSTFLFEEFTRERDRGRLVFDLPPLAPIGVNVLLHGHCHQKAFDVMGPVQKVLARVRTESPI
jgi:Fe-S oxidoreductase